MEDVFVPRSGDFEGQASRSKVKVTKDKNGIFGPFGGLRAVMFGKTSLASSQYHCFKVSVDVIAAAARLYCSVYADSVVSMNSQYAQSLHQK